MLKAVKTTLAIIMLIGCIVIFSATITGRVNLIVGLPLFVLPMALVISYFFPKYINNKSIFSYFNKHQISESINTSYQEFETEINTNIDLESNIENENPISFINEHLKDIPESLTGKQIVAACNEEFYTFLLSIIDNTSYFINVEEQLNNILVFNRQNSDYDALNKVNLSYVIHQAENEKVVMVINIYKENESQKIKLQLAKLFNKVKIPLLALHNQQSYSERDLIEAIIATLNE